MTSASVAIDAKKVSGEGEADRWEIFTHGGRQTTGIDAVEFAQKVVSLGAGEILLTSMDRDGTKAGYDGYRREPWLTACARSGNSFWVVSAIWITWLRHCDGHATAVLAASIFHFAYTIGEAKRYMAEAGILMRLSIWSGRAD